MSTRSCIALHNPESGTIQTIYCHFDGYPEHNGKILLDHYKDPAKITQLMALGDISALGPEIGEKQDFKHPTDTQWCLAYTRDRGEPEHANEVYANISDLVFEFRATSRLDFLYLYYEGKWMFSDSTGKLKTLKACDCEIDRAPNGCCGDCG